MSIPMVQEGSCCAPAVKGVRTLLFQDGCQVSVKGLDSIFDEAYREGKSADLFVARDMVTLLSKDNYIPSSAWSEYEDVVLKEYQKFVEAKKRG